jgi:transcriptional regulator with XRE-family HTH domain
MTIKLIKAAEHFEKKYGPLSLGDVIKSLRETEEISQTHFAAKLKISRANLCDIEKNRKLISPERAAKFANFLGFPEKFFIQLALDDLLRQAKLKYQVELKAS